MTLINCEIELNLIWSKSCVISELSRKSEEGGNNPVDTTQTTGETFKIKSAKLYVPVVTLSINDNIKLKEKQRKDLKEHFHGINIDLK